MGMAWSARRGAVGVAGTVDRMGRSFVGYRRAAPGSATERGGRCVSVTVPEREEGQTLAATSARASGGHTLFPILAT